METGGTVFYLGANGISEYGTYSADMKEMIFRAGVEGGSRADALFRVLQDPPRPERTLLGVCTERCGVPGSPYIVNDATHPFFAGIKVYDPTTGIYRNLQNGDRFGGEGLNKDNGNGKASGWEVDTSSGPGATGVPLQCEFEDRDIPENELPAGLKNLASGETDAAGPGADMIHYAHSGGGFVFAVGSITFGGSLVIDPVIQQLMRNVLRSAGIT